MELTENMSAYWEGEAAEEGARDYVTARAAHDFGIKYLFPWQRLVVANILDAVEKATTPEAPALAAETDEAGVVPDIAEDPRALWSRQVVLLPTGAGKSLCFLLPAAILDRPTLIVYPLLALMADQKRRMDAGSLEAVVFRGEQTPEEREENFRKLKNGAKVIIANPEVLLSDALCARLAKCNIVHAAIDEAHCIAEWGDSFRPAYLELGKRLEMLHIPVITAFTATASPGVLARLSEVLFGDSGHILRSDSDRPNIHYAVHYAYAKSKAALELAATMEKPLIVFCGTRNRTEVLARLLGSYFGKGADGESTVKFYHAGLSRQEKTAVEKWFFPRKDAVLCATCAFGMGVDKADIRTVIHLDPPATAEAYIQEAGRGGRDGAVANAVLIWSGADRKKAQAFPPGSRERVLADFAESGRAGGDAPRCRRQILLDALGGEQAPCAGCDICTGTPEKSAHDAAMVLRYFRDSGGATEFDAADHLRQLANRRDVGRFGERIWEHSDFEEIMDALKEEGALRPGRGIFHGKLVENKKKHRKMPICY
jgi:ATP-dependent DNA helicase RecQ